MIRTKLLFIIFLLSLSTFSQAHFIERDLYSVGDGLLTYVEDLNIEILDVTQVIGGNHRTVKEEMKNGLYSGYRFMSNSEMFDILSMLVKDPTRPWDFNSQERQNLTDFLRLIDSKGGPFTTCNNPTGCELIGQSDPYVVVNGSHHEIYTGWTLFNADGYDVGQSFLVRDVFVSEPTSLLLILLCPLALIIRRKRHNTSSKQQSIAF
ncbi:MAG: hypothetical protein P8X89_24475 [Reinekea sp.]